MRVFFFHLLITFIYSSIHPSSYNINNQSSISFLNILFIVKIIEIIRLDNKEPLNWQDF